MTLINGQGVSNNTAECDIVLEQQCSGAVLYNLITDQEILEGIQPQILHQNY